MQCTYLHIYADIKEFIQRTKTKLKDSRKKRQEVVKRKYPYSMLTYVILRGYNQYEMNVLNLNWERKVFQSTYIFLVINTYVALILDSSDSSLYFFAMYCTYGINIALNQSRATCIWILFYRLISMHSVAHLKPSVVLHLR